jgi:hypothetical protein
MLGCLAALLSNNDHFQRYLSDWITGHFLPLAPIVASYRRFDALLRRRYPPQIYSRTASPLSQPS